MKKSKNAKLRYFVAECKATKTNRERSNLAHDYKPGGIKGGRDSLTPSHWVLYFRSKETIMWETEFFSKSFNYAKVDSEKIANEFLEDYAFKFKCLDGDTKDAKEEHRYAYSCREYMRFIENYDGDLKK